MPRRLTQWLTGGHPGTGKLRIAGAEPGIVDFLPVPAFHLPLMKLFLCGLVFASCLGTTLAATPEETASQLKIIRAVGPEGQGNAAASAAWKQLAEGGAPTLLPILAAMDGANDYALNWLRCAVDAIAGRELDAGRKLPLAELGKFLLEPGHSPRARRLAFELVAQTDPGTADQLLPGMLNDASLELRHDAVQKLIDQANLSLTRSNQVGAALLYQQALSSARDVAQVEAIAEKLTGMGQPVDLKQHYGFLTAWKVIGPFDNSGRKGFEVVYPPELKIDLAAELDGKQGKVRWQDYATTHKYGMVDMNQPCGKLKEVTAYATTDFFSDTARAVELRLGGKNSWKVWLNGKFLFGRDEYHTDTEIDQYPMPAQLQPGRNIILVKVCQNEEIADWTNEWEFQLRITDALGTPILSTGQARTAAARSTSGNSTTTN